MINFSKVRSSDLNYTPAKLTKPDFIACKALINSVCASAGVTAADRARNCASKEAVFALWDAAYEAVMSVKAKREEFEVTGNNGLALATAAKFAELLKA